MHVVAPSYAADEPATSPPDSGLASLLMMAQLHGLVADQAKLQHEFGQEAFNSTTLILAAKSLGFSAALARQPTERLHKAPSPCIAIDSDGRFFILAKVDTGAADSGKESYGCCASAGEDVAQASCFISGSTQRFSAVLGGDTFHSCLSAPRIWL